MVVAVFHRNCVSVTLSIEPAWDKILAGFCVRDADI